MKRFYTALLVILPSIIFAQSNYHAGYVLKNSGDTLKGFIDYREWERTPLSIDFKINKDDKQKLEFNPATIKGFQITGLETYVAYIGMISMNPTSISDAPEELDTTQKLDTIFLRQVTTGEHLTLFYHNDKLKTRFFIAETNSFPVELKYYIYYEDQQHITKKDIYKGQLLLYINKFDNGNARLNTVAERASYEELDLESLVDKVNNKADTKKRTSSRLFVGFGVNRTTTELSNVNFSGVIQYYNTISPKISAGIDLFVNPNTQQLVFRTELSFSYVNVQNNFPLAVNERTANGPTTDGSYSFKQYTATITPQLLFNVYNTDKIKVYLDGGLDFHFSAYADHKLITPQSGVVVNNPFKLKPDWTSFPLQAGVIINKKVEIYLSRAGYAPFTNYLGFSERNQTMSLGVKFLLGKN
ncbi:MAG: hypothetical protein ABI203_05975 [Mucilaginibacter sp.]